MRSRVGELESGLEDLHKKKEFRALDELKWYALDRELREYRFILKASEFRAAHPNLFETDFAEGKEHLPWDRRLFLIGQELATPQQTSRETSVYRLLRDVYLDPSSQEKMVQVADSVLRSGTAPESLKEAVRLLKKQVREHKLPKPEALERVRQEQIAQAQVERHEQAAQAKTKQEAAKRSPLIESISQELGMSPQDLLHVRETLDLLEYYGKMVGQPPRFIG